MNSNPTVFAWKPFSNLMRSYSIGTAETVKPIDAAKMDQNHKASLINASLNIASATSALHCDGQVQALGMLKYEHNLIAEDGNG